LRANGCAKPTCLLRHPRHNTRSWSRQERRCSVDPNRARRSGQWEYRGQASPPDKGYRAPHPRSFSGGTTPEGQGKLHLYWKLQLRYVIAAKVGDDRSFQKPAQPIRIAGLLVEFRLSDQSIWPWPCRHLSPGLHGRQWTLHRCHQCPRAGYWKVTDIAAAIRTQPAQAKILKTRCRRLEMFLKPSSSHPSRREKLRRTRRRRLTSAFIAA
jgi:hypothetical protein